MDNEVNAPADLFIKPQIGMNFSSEDDAYDFYNKYGRNVGFSIRRSSVHRRKEGDTVVVTDRRFVCSKEGTKGRDKRNVKIVKPRAETRCNCLATMFISRLSNGQYVCREFIEKHNHDLHTPNTAHFMRSQRAISSTDNHAIELADGSSITPKANFGFLDKQAGGTENLGFTQANLKNYIRTKRQRKLEYGEAGALTKYFQDQSSDNPLFKYFIQFDKDEQVTNIFWADPRMIIDYALFGDVVSFDTTFCTNKDYRPLAIFFGFNHHRGAVIFGAALLYDETIDSFVWLFERFLEAHAQKKPITIFTDQDKVMAAAISMILPDTWHGLCIWHLMQNGKRYHGNLMKEGSCFLKDLKRCIYEYTDVGAFEIAWAKFRADYPQEKTTWLDHLYEIKVKWASCYMKNTFTLGMRSTQLNENINADLKGSLNCTLNVQRFFEHFERFVQDKRDKELKAEFDARNKLPRNMGFCTPILDQASVVYTPYAYELFLAEVNLREYCYLKSRQENEHFCQYEVSIDDVAGRCKKGVFSLLYIPSETMVDCSCKKFEIMGILCCHALKILSHLDIKCIPTRYILKRWTRTVRSMVVEDNKGKQVAEDVRLDYTRRYKYICPKYINLLTQACTSVQGFDVVKNGYELMCSQVDNVHIHDPTTEASSMPMEINKELVLKKKVSQNGGKSKRHKPWPEKMKKQKKGAAQQTLVPPSQPTDMLNEPHDSQEFLHPQSFMELSLNIPSSQASASTNTLSQASVSTLRPSETSETNPGFFGCSLNCG